MEIDNKTPYNITVDVELNVIDIQEHGVMCERENCIINCYILFNQFKFTYFFPFHCFVSPWGDKEITNNINKYIKLNI